MGVSRRISVPVLDRRERTTVPRPVSSFTAPPTDSPHSAVLSKGSSRDRVQVHRGGGVWRRRAEASLFVHGNSR